MTLLGEVGLGSVKAGEPLQQMVRWARKYGIQSAIHTGGPSIPGSGLIDKGVVLEADAGIIEAGKATDLMIMDRAQHAPGKTILEPVELGNLPGGGGMTIVDGTVRPGRSRNARNDPTWTSPGLVHRSGPASDDLAKQAHKRVPFATAEA